MHPRRGPIGLCGEHRPPQVRQAAGTGKAGDHQSVVGQRIAQVEQRAGQIVDAVERSEADDQVVGAAVERAFLVQVGGIVFVDLGPRAAQRQR